MNETLASNRGSKAAPAARPAAKKKTAVTLTEHVVEIVSDSGEGAQRCGQSLGSIAARMGNGVWTVEIIPAEIQPPARSIEGASGNRIRLGAKRVSNGGNETDLVVAFNEQVLIGRVRAGELKPGCTILLESAWREHSDPKIAASYTETHDRLVTDGYKVSICSLRASRSFLPSARKTRASSNRISHCWKRVTSGPRRIWNSSTAFRPHR